MAADPHAADPTGEKIIHVYDDIREADNDLPKWWLGVFFGTIAFALVYWFVFHEFRTSPLPMEEYAAELAKANPGGGGTMSAELLVALSKDPNAVGEGKAVYAANCVACHEAGGQGKIGPNLTDAFWIKGGAPEQIYATVAKGSLSAGMPGWEGPLGQKKTQQVVAFVLSIRDTNVAGKEPQGERWPPEAGAGAAPAADTTAPAAADKPADAAANPAGPSPAPTAAPAAPAPAQ